MRGLMNFIIPAVLSEVKKYKDFMPYSLNSQVLLKYTNVRFGTGG